MPRPFPKMMRIAEPVSMLTDYALGAASLFFAALLLRTIRVRSRISVRLWSIGFIATGIAAFAGGTYHGLSSYLDASVLRALWGITMCAVGISSGFMVSGVLTSSISKKDESRKWLIRGVLVTMAGIAIQQTPMRRNLNFNHNDIYHVIQAGALYLFFRGARLLKDK